MLTELFNLYLIFLKIGALSFGGGYASIPLIEKYIVEQNGWITRLEFRDLVSISQMTPGPIAINSATFVGQRANWFYCCNSWFCNSSTNTYDASWIFFIYKKQKV